MMPTAHVLLGFYSGAEYNRIFRYVPFSVKVAKPIRVACLQSLFIFLFPWVTSELRGSQVTSSTCVSSALF